VVDARYPLGQDTAYSQISLTSGVLCGLSLAGEIDCYNLHARTPFPSLPGPWVGVSAGIGHVCAESAAGPIRCWGGRFDDPEHYDPSAQSWSSYLSTEGGVCGLGSGSVVECSPEAARYERTGLSLTSLVERNGVACGHTSGGGLVCWGDEMTRDSWGYPESIDDTDIVDVAFGRWGGRHCLLLRSGLVHCIGTPEVPDRQEGIVSPSEPMSAIAMSSSYGLCGIDSTGVVRCSTGWKHAVWGVPKDGTRFVSIEAGLDIYCGLSEGGVVRCWGLVM